MPRRNKQRKQRAGKRAPKQRNVRMGLTKSVALPDFQSFETQARIDVNFASGVGLSRQVFVAGLKTSVHDATSPAFFA
jgi:hypothetical protein